VCMRACTCTHACVWVRALLRECVFVRVCTGHVMHAVGMFVIKHVQGSGRKLNQKKTSKNA